MRMKKNNTIYYLFILFSLAQISDNKEINRVFIMELKSWLTDQPKSDKTCIKIIGTGEYDIDFGLIVSNGTGKQKIEYHPSIYLAKEFFSSTTRIISIYSYNCAYDFKDDNFATKQEIISFISYELAEFNCVDCISALNMVKITANIRIISNEFKNKYYSVTFQNTNIIFNNFKLENGSCCKKSFGLEQINKCDGCDYNYLISIDEKNMVSDNNYDTATNERYGVQNTVSSGNFQQYFSSQSKINITIQENRINKIDEFGILIDLKLYPYRRIYYYSISGDYKNVEISGSLMAIKENSCGNYGFKTCNYINENITYNDNTEKICSNPIFINPPACSFDISPCARSPCKNQAKCISIIGNYECICEQGWAGINCDKPISIAEKVKEDILLGNKFQPKAVHNKLNLRSSLSCNNYTKCRSGRCVINNGIRKCECDETKSFGIYCEYSCSNVCKNGKCVLLKDKPTCICGDALLGIRCGGIDKDKIKKIKEGGLIGGFIVFLIITIAALICCYFISKTTKYSNFLEFKMHTKPKLQTSNLGDTSMKMIVQKSNDTYYENIDEQSFGIINKTHESDNYGIEEKSEKNEKQPNGSYYFAPEITYEKIIKKQNKQCPIEPNYENIISNRDDSF